MPWILEIVVGFHSLCSVCCCTLCCLLLCQIYRIFLLMSRRSYPHTKMGICGKLLLARVRIIIIGMPNPKSHDSAHAFFPYSLFSARALSKKKRGKFSNLPRSHFQNVSLRQSYCSSPRCSAYCSASAISESLPFSCSSSMSRTYA